uniref:Glycosyl hydrolase family 13 catalytic domain-containing protein n=2 Tax=Pyricularia oryzae TaxID=318829 RepID=Q2KES2_PYRO7|nr:hypothetical protein MGCH7_ch7g964 [Pyricularia oryzae 70-15]
MPAPAGTPVPRPPSTHPDGRTGDMDPAAAPSTRNETLFQGFEWHLPADKRHWRRLINLIPSLAPLGITKLWIPPACKGGGGAWSNGYDVYDLYDLGQFDQKGSRATKWGPRTDLDELVRAAGDAGIEILFDAVLNHKAGADSTERVLATRVDPEDRRKQVDRPGEIEAWTKFDFPGRMDQYSSRRWNKAHFTGVDYDNATGEKAIWLFEGKKWAEDVNGEFGNYDYLMFADIDHSHPEVRSEFFKWAEWLNDQMLLGGLRLDAVKHISRGFVQELVAHFERLRDAQNKPPWFVVGEYFSDEVSDLDEYLEALDHRIRLFDVPLLKNFSRISFEPRPDLRTIFDGTLCASNPDNAVTFVASHDTQRGQTMDTPVAEWFVPIAYALILLRANTGTPCVFYGDLLGTLGPFPSPPVCGGQMLPKILQARKSHAHGRQIDYFASAQTIGFVRFGGLAVVMNTGWQYAVQKMFVGVERARERWVDLLMGARGEVLVDANGYGDFWVGPRGVAVWTLPYFIIGTRLEVDYKVVEMPSATRPRAFDPSASSVCHAAKAVKTQEILKHIPAVLMLEANAACVVIPRKSMGTPDSEPAIPPASPPITLTLRSTEIRVNPLARRPATRPRASEFWS